jgi:hypothetical protein
MTEETEDEMLRRIAKQIFGEAIELTPVKLEEVRELYYLELAKRNLDSKDVA